MSVLGSFSGSDQKKDLTQAKAKADADLQQGYDTGRADYSRASGLFDPYAQTGGRANAMYADATGVNGRPAYDAAVSGFSGDPFRQSNEDFANEQLKRTFNARGSFYGGNAMLAASRGSLERGSTDWNNWLNRLQGQGQQGFAATGAQAGIATGQGDMAMGYGQTRAGNDINFGNAMASNRNTLTNNLLATAGTAAKAVGAMYGVPPMPVSRNAMRA